MATVTVNRTEAFKAGTLYKKTVTAPQFASIAPRRSYGREKIWMQCMILQNAEQIIRQISKLMPRAELPIL